MSIQRNFSNFETSSSSNLETCSSNRGRYSDNTTPKLSKCEDKLIQVQNLMYEVQCTLGQYHERSNELKKKNKKLAEKNKSLKDQIKVYQEFHRKVRNNPSNTSKVTQESDWFKSKDSFDMSSASSVDSIRILNDQVENIKEFKTMNYKERSINMHRKTNSIDKSMSFDKAFKGPKRKNCLGNCGIPAIEKGLLGKWQRRSGNKGILERALVYGIPVLKLN